MLVAVVAAALLVAAQAVPAGAGNVVRFGAALSTDYEPSNSVPAHECNDDGDPCTWVMNTPFKRDPGEQKAPMNGTIHTIRLIAGAPGSFKLQIGRIKPDQGTAKIVRSGPKITYAGIGFDGGDNIEEFDVNVTVRKGDVLAIRARRTSALRCDSGGPKIFQFVPKLPVGGPFQTKTDDDGCFLMIEAEY
jgi:hypothetical protein